MKKNKANFSTSANFLMVIAISLVIAFYLKRFLIPFVLAIFIYYVILEIRQLIMRVPFINKHFPKWLLNLSATMLLVFAIWESLNIVITNLERLSQNMDLYNKNLSKIITELDQNYHVNVQSRLDALTGSFDINSVFSSAFSTATSMISSLSITMIYLVFIFMESEFFQKKILSLYSNPLQRSNTAKIMKNITHSVGRYVALKTLTSFLTGILSYFALVLIGIDGAPFWAFLIFVMNFIPTVGSLVATAFPTLFAIVQTGQLETALTVLIVITIIQLVVGNGIEPKLMGDSLNISPLVVLLALSLWGILWGIVGMILSVPITVVLVLIFNEIPSTKPIAILLSKDGEI